MNDSELVADGLDHQLDPNVVPLQRITGGIFAALVSFGSMVGIGINMMVWDGAPGWTWIARPLLWLAFTTFLAWHAYRWPPRAYQHTSYRLDNHGIEIRIGVYWRAVVNVPRSRVQHIDVSQGPVERRYGLGTLVIYTAGTEHAKVELQGLEHGRALEIRQLLLPEGTTDAV